MEQLLVATFPQFLKFDIKDFINPSSIERSALTPGDLTTNDVVSSLMIKGGIEDHLLPHFLAYWESGSTPFGNTPLGTQPGDTGDSPLAGSILDGSFTHHNLAVRSLTSHLR
jgi:hypothetical protein